MLLISKSMDHGLNLEGITAFGNYSGNGRIGFSAYSRINPKAHLFLASGFRTSECILGNFKFRSVGLSDADNVETLIGKLVDPEILSSLEADSVYDTSILTHEGAALSEYFKEDFPGSQYSFLRTQIPTIPKLVMTSLDVEDLEYYDEIMSSYFFVPINLDQVKAVQSLIIGGNVYMHIDSN